MSAEWRVATEELGSILGVTVSIVDVSSGATLTGGSAPAVCAALLGAEPVPGLTCVLGTEREADANDPRPIHGQCAAGLQTALAPIRHEGAVVCHAMVSGFTGSARGRHGVLKRLLDAGVAVDAAREMLEEVPALDHKRAGAIARTVVSRAEGLLRERVAVDARVARGCEMAMLAEVARDLGPTELMYGRIPEAPLRSLMRLTGADSAVVYLARPGWGESGPAARAGDEPDASVGEMVEGAADHVRETGRSFVSTGADEGMRKVSLVGVPLGDRGCEEGVLVLAKAGPEALGADDVRVAELFAETLAAMLVNARDFVDANVKLIELMQVNEVAQLLNSTLDHEKLAEISVEVLAKTLAFDVGGFVLDGFGEQRGRVLHWLDVGRSELQQLVGDAWGTDPGPGLLDGVTVVGRSAAIVEDGECEQREWTLLSRELRFRNVRAGELFVASCQIGAFDSDDERILGALAAHLSTALENAVLYSRLNGDFQRALAALSALADATERLDRGHTDRVMDYAVSLGQEMGLSADRLGLLRFAGLLHDLGKVGIAEEILIKPSVLTDAEMELVRQHSEMGATIVEQVKVLEKLTPIVRHHHEHWDGGGYPEGLAGEDIPLEARILAVADAFEAMTGQRHHRKRLPVSAARLEIERGAGTQFDPDVAKAFLVLLDRRALFGATGGYVRLTSDRSGPELPA